MVGYGIIRKGAVVDDKDARRPGDNRAPRPLQCLIATEATVIDRHTVAKVGNCTTTTTATIGNRHIVLKVAVVNRYCPLSVDGAAIGIIDSAVSEA